MKKVVSKTEVAHLWANQLQDEARTPTQNMYFNGDTIYSYGSHFAIAKHVTNDKGESAVLFNVSKYSVTTSDQQWITRSASKHLNIIECYHPASGSQSNFNDYLDAIKEYLPKLAKAKKPELYTNEISRVFNQAKKYADFFGYDIPAILSEYGNINTKDQIGEVSLKEAALIQKQIKEAEKRRKKEDAAAKVKFTKTLNKWREFDFNGTLRSITKFDYLRYNKDKHRVETSQSIQVPADIAKGFYTTVLDIIAKGGCNDCNIDFMQKYRVYTINADFIRVGCHTIEISEIKALTTKLGW